MKNKFLNTLVLAAGFLFLAAALLSHFNLLSFKGKEKVITSSTLTDAIDIAELSAAEFRYRGIADVYSDEEKAKIKCRICYNSTVKAGIDMEKVEFDINTEDKTVTAALPDIQILVNVVDDQSMALLPTDADIGIDEMLKYSKEDAEREAMESDELIETARENLKMTIEGLLYPVLHAQGYSLAWK